MGMLWVITCYFNSKNDPRRLSNFVHFASKLKKQNVPLCTVELCTSENVVGLDPTLSTKSIRLNHKDVLWCKEALLNIALKNLPPECTKVCWMDADIEFLDNTWAKETEKLLDVYNVVQPHTAHVFMEEGEVPDEKVSDKRKHPSFAVEAARRRKSQADAFAPPIDFHKYHPGHVWAARRDKLDELGGFFPFCILGHGDIVMATAFFGHPKTMRLLWEPKGYLGFYTRHWSKDLKSKAQIWQKKAAKIFERKIGCAEKQTIAYHWFHGSVKSRQYEQRGSDLNFYNPDVHTIINDVGLITWSNEAPISLKDALDTYFQKRKEG